MYEDSEIGKFVKQKTSKSTSININLVLGVPQTELNQTALPFKRLVYPLELDIIKSNQE